MHPFWKSLGDAVLSQWKRENFSLEKFPAIATAALAKHPPAKHVDLASLVTDFLLSDEQPAQTDSDFGQPELVAYSHPRFYIQLLFWMDGTTAIHQHEFSGAFHVMHGSSIHAHYDFEKPTPITPHLRMGHLKMKDMELLETGRTVPIISGPTERGGTIHSLFHLESPSVTVVVRTQHDPGTGPQFNYMPPHVAFDPHFSDKLTARRKQLLDVIMQSEGASYADLVKQMVSDLDFERGFSILHHAQGYLQHLDEWDATLNLFEKKHGAVARGVRATLAEDVRRTVLKDFRTTVTEPEHRFFLALLMNAPTRAVLFDLVSQRFRKTPPTATLLRWLAELTDATDEGTTVLDAAFPGSLGVAPESQPALFLAALQHFLSPARKLPPALRDLSPKAMRELRAAFAHSTLSVLIA